MADEYIDRDKLEYFWGKIKALPQMAVESGDGYCKMADGTMFCWGIIVTVVNFNTAWGGAYYGNVLASDNITFPTAFTAKPTVEITINSGAFAYVVGSNATATGISDIFLVRPTAVQSTMTVAWFAVGRWTNTTVEQGWKIAQSDWNQTDATASDFIKNKPTTQSYSASSITANSTYIQDHNLRYCIRDGMIDLCGWFRLKTTAPNNTVLFSGLPSIKQEHCFVAYDQNSLTGRMVTYSTGGNLVSSQGVSESSAVNHYLNLSVTATLATS